MKILLLGHGRHGKDTVAEIMRDYHGISFRSSSNWAAENVIYPHLMDTLSSMYTAGRDWQWFYDNRHEDLPGCGRKLWYDVIKAYNSDPYNEPLAEQLLAEVDVYVGMRSRYEFEQSKHLFDHVIWVDRSEHEPPESFDSMELTEEDTDLWIDNNGSMRDLWIETDAMVAYLRRYANG